MSKKKIIFLGKIVSTSSFLTFVAINLSPDSSKKTGSVSQQEATKFAVVNKKLVAKLSHRATNKPLLPKDGLIKKQKLETIMGKKILGFDKSVKYSFKIRCDENKGIAYIETSINKNHKKIITHFKIEGFKTFNEIALEKVTQADLPLLQANKDVLASSGNKPDNGIIENDIHYTFTKWEHSNEGKIDWTISLQKGQATREFSGEITVFLPLKKVRNEFINKKEDEHTTSTTTSSGVNPPVDSKVLFTTKKKLETPKTNLKINNQKPLQDQEDLNAITIDDIRNIKNIPRQASVLPTAISKPKDTIIKGGINVAYTYWEPMNEQGIINFDIVLTKGSAKRVMKLWLPNLLTTNQYNQIEKWKQDQKAINAVTKNELGLPRPSNVESTSVNKPIDGTTTSGVNYKFTKWDQYGIKGEIHWEVKLTIGLAKERLLNGKIVGYKKSIVKPTKGLKTAGETFKKLKNNFIWKLLGRTT